MRYVVLCIGILTAFSAFSQQENPEAREKALSASKDLTYEANAALAGNDFVEAEARYRKAISKSGENTTAKYNMGNAYYRENSMDEAMIRYKQAGETAQTKAEKHRAHHNMGNVFMNNKAYDKAVEAYKEALRNNPSDEETRYNLALAKEMLEKQQEQQKNDQNKDQQDQEDNKDKQDKKDGEGDQKDNKEDKGDQEDGKDQEQDKDKEDGKQKEENKDQGEKGKQPRERQENQQPRPSQLSPQQIKNILEAMNNEEKKVQEKMNAKKVKGVPVKTEKDW